MINISNNGFIAIHRGDSFKVPLLINTGTKSTPTRLYVKQHPGASIYFGVMEPNQPFEDAVIKKRFTSRLSTTNSGGDLEVKFKPSDTEYLTPGRYYYAVKTEVIQMEHNVNYSLEGTPYIFVYGWTGENTSVTAQDLSLQFRPGQLTEVVGVNQINNGVMPLYAKADIQNEYVLHVYDSLSIEGNPVREVARINMNDLAKAFVSAPGDTIVDTIIPLTDFVIYD